MPVLTELKPTLQPLSESHAPAASHLDAQAAVAEASHLLSEAQKSNRTSFRRIAADDQRESAPRLLSFPEWLVELALRPETPWYERMALLGALTAF